MKSKNGIGNIEGGMLKNSGMYRLLSVAFLLVNFTIAGAQMKVTDGSVVTIDPNAILDLESSDKGLLVPRVAIGSLTNASPLTAPVTVGMLVFSSGGTVSDGFYYWSGTSWENIIGTPNTKTFTYSANATIPHTNCIVFASNDITLTLPVITASDTGLQIVVKNAGSHIHKVTVKGNGSATIEGGTTVEILPRSSRTFIARGTNWLLGARNLNTDDIINVGKDEPFEDISDAIDYMKIHMDRPMILRLGAEEMLLSHTEVIDLPYPLTIQGASFGGSIIKPAAGIAGKPLFRCKSECYFKMLILDASGLAGYGTSPGEDAIRFLGSGTYNEVKDTFIEGFYNGIIDSTNAELWLFETDIKNAKNNGLLIHSNLAGAKVRVADTDFMECKTGINLSKGSQAQVQIQSAVFTNSTDGTAILYNPSTFSFTSLIIMNNSWNNLGTGITGFDFTRSDGRDAECYIENNAGMLGNKPHSTLSVVNNSQTVTCVNANTLYKASWTNTHSSATNMKVENNKVTYLPKTRREITILISGDVNVDKINRVISISIVKNGNTSVKYGETALRVTVASQPFQFSTVIHLEDVGQNDYFEMYCSSADAGDILNFRDINWYVTSL